MKQLEMSVNLYFNF